MSKNMSIRERFLILERRIARKISLRWLEKVHYNITTGRTLNLKHPQYFDEKLMWLNHYDINPLKTQCADKYRIHQYMEKKGLAHYLVPLLGHWHKPEEIDYAEFPNAFVLKCNHGCGFNIFVKDKSKMDLQTIGKRLNGWLKVNYGGGA